MGVTLETHSVDQVGLELRDLVAFTSWVLGLKWCTPLSSYRCIFTMCTNQLYTRTILCYILGKMGVSSSEEEESNPVLLQKAHPLPLHFCRKHSGARLQIQLKLSYLRTFTWQTRRRKVARRLSSFPTETYPFSTCFATHSDAFVQRQTVLSVSVATRSLVTVSTQEKLICHGFLWRRTTTPGILN
jgi:hypothetical protein